MEVVRVLGLFGSPRRGGNTDLLLERMLQGAEEGGASVERVYACELHISPCQECQGCFSTGKCVVEDDMQSLYPRLIEAWGLILASPIFFYGVTAQVKALIDRCQAFWVRKYRLKDPVGPLRGRQGRGFFISVGGTRGKTLFDGARLTVRYFFDTLDLDYGGELLFRGIDEKGEIVNHPTALQEAYEAGKRLVMELLEINRERR